MSRSRVRAFKVGGLRVAVEVPRELAWDWDERAFGPFRCRPERPDVCIAVRVGAAEEVPGLVRVAPGFECAFTASGATWAVRESGRLERVLRMDAALRDGELVVAPDARCVRGGAPPLAGLDALLLRHRLAREGRVALDVAVAGSATRALAFAAPDPGLLHALRECLGADRAAVRAGLMVLDASPSGPRLHPTPWMRTALGPSARSVALQTLHSVRRAPDVLAEPLAGRPAVEEIVGSLGLLAGDPVGEAMARAALCQLLPRLRVVRLGAPLDGRLRRYAFGAPAGGPGARSGARDSRPARSSRPGGVFVASSGSEGVH